MLNNYLNIKNSPGPDDGCDPRRESIVANQVYRAMNIRECWQSCPLCDGEGCQECDYTGYIHPDDLREFEAWCTQYDRLGLNADLEEWEVGREK